MSFREYLNRQRGPEYEHKHAQNCAEGEQDCRYVRDTRPKLHCSLACSLPLNIENPEHFRVRDWRGKVDSNWD